MRSHDGKVVNEDRSPFMGVDPEVLIERLMSSDMKFWAKVRNEVIVPYLRRSRFGKMAEDRNVPVDEVYDYVYPKSRVMRPLLHRFHTEAFEEEPVASGRLG